MEPIFFFLQILEILTFRQLSWTFFYNGIRTIFWEGLHPGPEIFYQNNPSPTPCLFNDRSLNTIFNLFNFDKHAGTIVV